MKPCNAAIEAFRLLSHPSKQDVTFGNNGFFHIPRSKGWLQVIASDGMGWDHVSVVPIDSKTQRPLYRTPTWEEMCFVKALFFADDEVVIQYHPRKADYRNAHEYCLHLWRPHGVELPTPDRSWLHQSQREYSLMVPDHGHPTP